MRDRSDSQAGEGVAARLYAMTYHGLTAGSGNGA
jgi:hypothetical protein